MSIMTKLSVRQLAYNKKRTVLTVIGVIITVAMLTAVFTFASSFQMMLRNEVLSRTGDWQVCYYDVNDKNLAVIAEDPGTSAYWLERKQDLAKLNEDEQAPYQFLSVTEISEPRLTGLGLKLASGRLPERQGELVVPAGLGITIGQQLTLPTGYRQLLESTLPGEEPTVVGGGHPFSKENEQFVQTGQITYTVVGLFEQQKDNYSGSAAADAYAYLDKSGLSDTARADLFVKVNNISGNLTEEAEFLAEQAGIPSVQSEGETYYDIGYNRELLRTYGITGRDATNEMIFHLEVFLVAIILTAGIALIYNAFAVSVSERTRQMGMLSSVGATGRQRRRMVYFEGLLIGLISIPLGIIFGLVGMQVLFLVLNNLLVEALGGIAGATGMTLSLYLSPEGLIATVVLALLTIFASAFVPALRAGRLSPITAIRQSKDVKLTARRVKTSRLTRRLFGFPAELGLKNLKRNKKRYRITIFSLTISIILFLTVSSFGHYMERAINMEGGTAKYDVVAYADGTVKENEKAFEEIEQKSGADIEKVHRQCTAISYVLVPEELMDGAVQVGDHGGMKVIYADLITMDDASMEEFCSANGLTPPRWENGQVSAILLNRAMDYDENFRRIELDLLKAQAGDSISLAAVTYDTNTGEIVQVEQGTTITLSAVTDAVPEHMNPYGGTASLRLLVPEELVESLKDSEGLKSLTTEAYYTTKEHGKLAEAFLEEDDFQVYDATANRDSSEKMLTAMSIAVYGFVTLIILICAVNILSTISTSIGLRAREFAMLRSVGMTGRDFSRMLNFESIFYGLKALLYGLPVSFLISVWIYSTMGMTYTIPFSIPVWSYAAVVAGVMLLVWLFMLFSSRKLKKQDILENMKTEVL